MNGTTSFPTIELSYLEQRKTTRHTIVTLTVTVRGQRIVRADSATGGTSLVQLAGATGQAQAIMNMKLEVVIIPVSDVDRAKVFYEKLGFRLDGDFVANEKLRVTDRYMTDVHHIAAL